MNIYRYGLLSSLLLSGLLLSSCGSGSDSDSDPGTDPIVESTVVDTVINSLSDSITLSTSDCYSIEKNTLNAYDTTTVTLPTGAECSLEFSTSTGSVYEIALAADGSKRYFYKTSTNQVPVNPTSTRRVSAEAVDRSTLTDGGIPEVIENNTSEAIIIRQADPDAADDCLMLKDDISLGTSESYPFTVENNTNCHVNLEFPGENDYVTILYDSGENNTAVLEDSTPAPDNVSYDLTQDESSGGWTLSFSDILPGADWFANYIESSTVTLGLSSDPIILEYNSSEVKKSFDEACLASGECQVSLSFDDIDIEQTPPQNEGESGFTLNIVSHDGVNDCQNLGSLTFDQSSGMVTNDFDFNSNNFSNTCNFYVAQQSSSDDSSQGYKVDFHEKLNGCSNLSIDGTMSDDQSYQCALTDTIQLLNTVVPTWKYLLDDNSDDTPGLSGTLSLYSDITQSQKSGPVFFGGSVATSIYALNSIDPSSVYGSFITNSQFDTVDAGQWYDNFIDCGKPDPDDTSLETNPYYNSNVNDIEAQGFYYNAGHYIAAQLWTFFTDQSPDNATSAIKSLNLSDLLELATTYFTRVDQTADGCETYDEMTSVTDSAACIGRLVMTEPDSGQPKFLMNRNDGSGQGSGSVATSEGIGFQMEIAGQILYLYSQRDALGYVSDSDGGDMPTEDEWDGYFTNFSKVFANAYQLWFYQEGGLYGDPLTKDDIYEGDSKKGSSCYADKLLVWSRGISGNPSIGDDGFPKQGSALDGDMYMTGGAYLVAAAYKNLNGTQDAKDLANAVCVPVNGNELSETFYCDGKEDSYQMDNLNRWVYDRATDIAQRAFMITTDAGTPDDIINSSFKTGKDQAGLPSTGDSECTDDPSYNCRYSDDCEPQPQSVQTDKGQLGFMYLFSKDPFGVFSSLDDVSPAVIDIQTVYQKLIQNELMFINQTEFWTQLKGGSVIQDPDGDDESVNDDGPYLPAPLLGPAMTFWPVMGLYYPYPEVADSDQDASFKNASDKTGYETFYSPISGKWNPSVSNFFSADKGVIFSGLDIDYYKDPNSALQVFDEEALEARGEYDTSASGDCDNKTGGLCNAMLNLTNDSNVEAQMIQVKISLGNLEKANTEGFNTGSCSNLSRLLNGRALSDDNPQCILQNLQDYLTATSGQSTVVILDFTGVDDVSDLETELEIDTPFGKFIRGLPDEFSGDSYTSTDVTRDYYRRLWLRVEGDGDEDIQEDMYKYLLGTFDKDKPKPIYNKFVYDTNKDITDTDWEDPYPETSDDPLRTSLGKDFNNEYYHTYDPTLQNVIYAVAVDSTVDDVQESTDISGFLTWINPGEFISGYIYPWYENNGVDQGKCELDSDESCTYLNNKDLFTPTGEYNYDPISRQVLLDVKNDGNEQSSQLITVLDNLYQVLSDESILPSPFQSKNGIQDTDTYSSGSWRYDCSSQDDAQACDSTPNVFSLDTNVALAFDRFFDKNPDSGLAVVRNAWDINQYLNHYDHLWTDACSQQSDNISFFNDHCYCSGGNLCSTQQPIKSGVFGIIIDGYDISHEHDEISRWDLTYLTASSEDDDISEGPYTDDGAMSQWVHTRRALTYDFDAGRTPENLGSFLILANPDNTVTHPQ